MIAVVRRTTAKLVLPAADIPTTVLTARTTRIGVTTRHACERIRTADFVGGATERSARFPGVADALAGGEIAVLSVRAGGHALVITAVVVVRTAFGTADLAIGAVAFTRRRVTWRVV